MTPAPPVVGALLLVGSVLTQGLALAATRASRGLRRPRWVVVAFLAMSVSVALMARAVAGGLPLPVAYGVWSGAGILVSAATGVVTGDRLARVHLVGLALVLAGVAVVYASA